MWRNNHINWAVTMLPKVLWALNLPAISRSSTFKNSLIRSTTWFLNAFLAALCVHFVASPVAWGHKAEQLLTCSKLSKNAERLECYDRMAAAAEAPHSGRSSFAPENKNSEFSDNRNNNRLETERKLSDGRESEIDTFGIAIDSSSTSASKIKFIRSRIVGEFIGWSGSSEFVLENGQVWRQADSTKAVYRAVSPEVTITRHLFGSYRLAVQGLNQTVRVKRVK